jgi:Protein of unknown function (DUF4231)
MNAHQAAREESDQSYIQWLKRDLGGLIDQLEISDLRKRIVKSRWLDQVAWLEKRATQARDWYYRLRLTTIIGGILIPVCITISQVSPLGWMAWVATGLGALVAIAAGVDGFFHYGDRWRNYRNSVELLKIEGWQFFQLSGPYSRRKSHEDAYEKFAARVEEIIHRDVQVYISEIVGEKETKQEEERAGTEPAGSTPQTAKE